MLAAASVPPLQVQQYAANMLSFVQHREDIEVQTTAARSSLQMRASLQAVHRRSQMSVQQRESLASGEGRWCTALREAEPVQPSMQQLYEQECQGLALRMRAASLEPVTWPDASSSQDMDASHAGSSLTGSGCGVHSLTTCCRPSNACHEGILNSTEAVAV